MKTMLSALAVFVCASAAFGVGEMFPFVPSYDAPDNVVNMSHLLEAPAGNGGRIRAEGGHFVNDRGRVRLNATNLTGPANFPTHEEAERLAARLARFGFNCVRLHYMDGSYGNFMMPPEQGILALDPKSQRALDPARLERMDYLVAALKKRGIYINMNLHVARNLDERDGVAPGTPGANKGVDQFDERIISLEKEYARDLLSHVNQYTGMSYLKDPAVAVVELSNEDSLWREYRDGKLDDLPDPYGPEFKALWNAWLVKKHGPGKTVGGHSAAKGEVPIVKHNEPASKDLQRDFHSFIFDTERAFWTSMRDYLRDGLGLEAPVSGTEASWFSTPQIQASLDYVDAHGYWCHPSVKKDWEIDNRAMVNFPGGTIGPLLKARVAGKPYTVSEYNHPYPNFYGAEGQLMLRAYGALGGWDGVFQYSYNNRAEAEPDFNTYFFNLSARTDVLAHMPAAAALYLRGDVAEGRAPIRLSPEKSRRIESDTKEIVWDVSVGGKGAWTVDTANTKVFSGFPAGRVFDLGGVKLAVGETSIGWATVSLVSHDATGFGEDGRAARILLAATSLSHNNGAKFAKHGGTNISCRGEDWGRGPVMNEGVPAVVTLPADAERVTCRALDERGEPKAQVPVAAGRPGGAVISIGPEYRTVWYEIDVAQLPRPAR